jgi:hypothetical protein
MLVKIGENTLEITFRIDRESETHQNGKKKAITICTISGSETIGNCIGTARQNHKDEFDSNKGRKAALAKALGQTILTKAQRRYVWSVYNHGEFDL